MTTQETAGWKPGDPVGYITTEIPEFQTPPYDGDRYEAMVPDTFDLQERARLVIHAMTEATDPLADYEPYYLVHFRTNPPSMRHSTWQGCLAAQVHGVRRAHAARERKRPEPPGRPEMDGGGAEEPGPGRAHLHADAGPSLGRSRRTQLLLRRRPGGRLGDPRRRESPWQVAR